VVVNFFGDGMCPSRLRDSDEGKLTWSALPPGHRCVWTKAMNGYDATEGPGWEASAYLVFMVVSGGQSFASSEHANTFSPKRPRRRAAESRRKGGLLGRRGTLLTHNRYRGASRNVPFPVVRRTARL